MYKEFLQYLEEKPSFKSRKIIALSSRKYADAVQTISDEMVEAGVIESCLYNIFDVHTLDKMIATIMKNEYFIEKNHRGNYMYSNALEHFRYFSHNR